MGSKLTHDEIKSLFELKRSPAVDPVVQRLWDLYREEAAGANRSRELKQELEVCKSDMDVIVAMMLRLKQQTQSESDKG